MSGTGGVDVVWPPRVPSELQPAILAEGVCLYRKNTAVKGEYEADVMGRYGDYLPVLRAQRTAVGRTERTLEQL